MMINLQTYSNWVSDKLGNSVIDFIQLNFNNTSFELFIKRDDLIHPIISGNKLRKLKYNIISAENYCCDRLITFGGAYSNHILATAFLSIEFKIPLTIYLRGDELNANSNKILSFCSTNGIILKFLTREEYSLKKTMNGITFLDGEKCWSIPEGGANEEGIRGASEILNEVNSGINTFVVAQGTTTTSIGLYRSMSENSTLIVVPVLKNFQSLFEMKKVDSTLNWNKKIISLEYSELGRYGRLTDILKEFQHEIQLQSTIKFDPVYTLKALYAYLKYTTENQNYSIQKEKVLFIHTGGLNQNWWD